MKTLLRAVWPRINADGSLDVTNVKRAKPRRMIPTGGYVLMNEKYDEKKPEPQRYCVGICSLG